MTSRDYPCGVRFFSNQSCCSVYGISRLVFNIMVQSSTVGTRYLYTRLCEMIIFHVYTCLYGVYLIGKVNILLTLVPRKEIILTFNTQRSNFKHNQLVRRYFLILLSYLSSLLLLLDVRCHEVPEYCCLNV